jgi:N-acetylglucosamine-6-phosphate deacetylase
MTEMQNDGLTKAICAPRLFDGDQWLADHAVLIEGETVAELLPTSDLPSSMPRVTLGDGILAPGFIDLQVNGGGGVLLNNTPDKTSIDRVTAAHRTVGTTAMMPTLISDTPQVHQAGVKAVAEAIHGGNRSVLGVHIEGPFFDRARRGTHKAEMIRELSEDDMAWLCSLQDFSVMLTLAPERTRPGQVKRLADAGIHVCAGHTDASHEQMQQAIAEGLRGFTHLFNAMSPITAREPGTVGAALDSRDTWVGVIADGHHVHPACIRIAQRAKADGKLLLVSDAMATVGSDDSGFHLYGEHIEVKEGRLVNAEGALAGSAIGMIDAVRFSHWEAGLELGECLRMAALYPAAFLAMDQRLGRVSPGFRADLVHFDPAFTVCNTWVAGEHRTHHRG